MSGYVRREWSCGCQVVYWPDSEDGPEEFPCPEAARLSDRSRYWWSLYSLASPDDKIDSDGALAEAREFDRHLQAHHAENGPVVEEVIR